MPTRVRDLPSVLVSPDGHFQLHLNFILSDFSFEIAYSKGQLRQSAVPSQANDYGQS